MDYNKLVIKALAVLKHEHKQSAKKIESRTGMSAHRVGAFKKTDSKVAGKKSDWDLLVKGYPFLSNLEREDEEQSIQERYIESQHELNRLLNQKLKGKDKELKELEKRIDKLTKEFTKQLKKLKKEIDQNTMRSD